MLQIGPQLTQPTIGSPNFQLLICFRLDAAEPLSIPPTNSYRGLVLIKIFPWRIVVSEYVVVVDFKALTIDGLFSLLVRDFYNRARIKARVRYPNPTLIQFISKRCQYSIFHGSFFLKHNKI